MKIIEYELTKCLGDFLVNCHKSWTRIHNCPMSEFHSLYSYYQEWKILTFALIEYLLSSSVDLCTDVFLLYLRNSTLKITGIFFWFTYIFISHIDLNVYVFLCSSLLFSTIILGIFSVHIPSPVLILIVFVFWLEFSSEWLWIQVFQCHHIVLDYFINRQSTNYFQSHF
jgi:hypothetical protein